MNAPLPEHIRQALDTVTLDDKYSLDYGRAFMSGVQALVKLPMLQRQRDALVGKNTAGFVSGYRGSPLGQVDQQVWKAKAAYEAAGVRFLPAINEELAATAEEMSAQAEQLTKTMAFFKLDSAQTQGAGRSRVLRAERRSGGMASAPLFEADYVQFEG